MILGRLHAPITFHENAGFTHVLYQCPEGFQPPVVLGSIRTELIVDDNARRAWCDVMNALVLSQAQEEAQA